MDFRAKDLTPHKFQDIMSRTFNVHILNNRGIENGANETNGVKAATTFDRTRNNSMGIIPRTPSLARGVGKEISEPFTFIPNAKIPDLTENRKEESQERRMTLLKQPKHKT